MLSVRGVNGAVEYLEAGGDPSLLPLDIFAELLAGKRFHRFRLSGCEMRPMSFMEALLECVKGIDDHVLRMRVGIAAFMVLDYRGVYDNPQIRTLRTKVEVAIGASYNRPRSSL
jgi:hypothetical protein